MLSFLHTHLGQIKVSTLLVPLLVFWVRVFKHLGICSNAKNELFDNLAKIMMNQRVKFGGMIVLVI